MNFCTYFDKNYLAKGRVCHETLNNFKTECILYILAFDETTYNVVENLKNVVPIKLEDIENYYPDLLKVKNERLPKEYYATISPILPLFIFDKYGIDKLFYTDADMAFWNDPKEIEEIIGDKSLMVVDQEFEPARNGIRFNVGILGYINDVNCREFLNWWKNRVIEWCKWETTPDHKMAEQGYLNIIYDEPNKFKNTLICPHIGINFGPWQFGKHIFTEQNGQKKIDFINNLICFHYHEFNIIDKNYYYATGWKHSENEKKIIYEPYFNIISKYI